MIKRSQVQILSFRYADVSEWFMVAVLKTAEVKASIGSNPIISAYLISFPPFRMR